MFFFHFCFLYVEAHRLAEEAEAAHRLAEEEARRIHDAEMAALIQLAKEEAAKRRAAEEELARVARELALKKQRDAEEARRLKLQAEAGLWEIIFFPKKFFSPITSKITLYFIICDNV